LLEHVVSEKEEEFQVMLVESKVTLVVEFDNFKTFSDVEVKKWLIFFMVYKVEINSLCKDQVSILGSIEDEFLTLKMKEKTTMV